MFFVLNPDLSTFFFTLLKYLLSVLAVCFLILGVKIFPKNKYPKLRILYEFLILLFIFAFPFIYFTTKELLNTCWIFLLLWIGLWNRLISFMIQDYRKNLKIKPIRVIINFFIEPTFRYYDKPPSKTKINFKYDLKIILWDLVVYIFFLILVLVMKKLLPTLGYKFLGFAYFEAFVIAFLLIEMYFIMNILIFIARFLRYDFAYIGHRPLTSSFSLDEFYTKINIWATIFFKYDLLLLIRKKQAWFKILFIFLYSGFFHQIVMSYYSGKFNYHTFLSFAGIGVFSLLMYVFRTTKAFLWLKNKPYLYYLFFNPIVTLAMLVTAIYIMFLDILY